MPMFSVRELGKRGLNTDLPPYELQLNEFTRAENIRFYAGAARKSPAPLDILTGITDAQWIDSTIITGTPALVYGTNGATPTLHYNGGGGWTDVTNPSPNSGPYTQADWQSTLYANTFIFNNGIQRPQSKSPTDSTFVDMPGWPIVDEASDPAEHQCKVIRTYKNFLVALNVTIGGTENGNNVMWSDAGTNEDLPANWNYGDPGSLSGIAAIGLGDGPIIDGLELGDSFIIYTANSAYSMTLTSSAAQPMAFRRLFEYGCISVDAIAAFDNYHLVIGRDHIYVHDGSTLRKIGENRVENIFFAGMQDPTTVKVEHNKRTHEIFIYMAAGTLNEGIAPSGALVWNYLFDAFSFVNVGAATCLHYGEILADVTTWNELDGDFDGDGTPEGAQTNWDQLIGDWSELEYADLETTLYAVEPTKLLELDRQFDDGTSSLNFLLERTGIDLDELQLTADDIKMCRRVYPQINGTGILRWWVGFSQTPDGAVSWSAPIDYDIDNDHKLDFRVSGRYLAWRCESSSAGNFALTGADFQIDPAGKR